MKIINMHTGQKIIITLCILSGVLLNSCQDNDEVPSPGSETKEVTFSVKVPGASAPKTKTLTESNENEVRSIEVLLFDNNGEYTYQPVYSNVINTDPDDSNIKTFTIKVPEGTYNMVILANTRQAVSGIVNSIHEGDSKASVLDKLVITNSNKWNTDPASTGYIPIPMFGEIPSISVNAALPSNTSVNLVRMVSKIDVALTNTDATNNFTLESIRLYNYNNKGYIAPLSGNWDQAQNVVTGASVPTGSILTQGPLLYDGTAITTAHTASSGEIYTFEAVGANPSLMGNATCLVIGGTYTGDSQPTYYRVDFARTSSSVTTYLPLLRNHYYKVNITKVSGRGLPTPADAFSSRPVNIEANVIMWDNAKIGDIVFDGQYMLGVSQREITFTRDARTIASTDNTFCVTTDYPPGWKIEKITDAAGNIISWLNVVSTTGSNVSAGISGSITDLKLNMPENTSGSDRTAFIHLSAGRLTHTVQVLQKTELNLSLMVTDLSGKAISELVFASSADVQPAAQQFKLKWNPVVFSITASRSDIYDMGFSFDGSSDQPGSGILALINDPSGEKTFTVRPTAITAAEIAANPFKEKVSVVDFRIGDPYTFLTTSIFLRQVRYNISTEKDVYYLMDGTQKYFTVKSNTNFTVEVKSNPDNVVQSLVTTSGGANTSGTRVYFNIINDTSNPALYYRDIVFTIKSPQGRFADTDITLPCYAGVIQSKSNSYIVNPGGTGILIPVSRANDSGIGTQLGVSESFTARLLWTDNANRIASNSNISQIHIIGTGSSAYLLVKQGSVSGNAVVEIKNASNTTLWSWHIWVTDYTPVALGTGKFMDRNLGAIGNTPGVAATKGLLYQWGRKDPFPGSSTLTGTDEPTLYTASGTISVTKTQVAVANNLSNSIANPFTFYYLATDPRDWYSNSGIRSDALWGPASKTVYDPCPIGWRVPQQGIWLLTNFTMGQNGAVWGSNGMTWTGYGGWYPAAGYRVDSNGNLTNVGSTGIYWTATNSGTSANYLSFTNSTVAVQYPTYRAGGFSVRCVAEQ
ncbi:MAG: FimB/Mfa2 family fimbrial subunit [Prevotella sp.]|jgi:hypothetical protein|nr:FimB/Mfa2 family fimbrial subunit [Prevotella sp.]